MAAEAMTKAPGGYFGRALVVDVHRGGSTVVELSDRVLRDHLGGVGLGRGCCTELAPPASTRWRPRRRWRSCSRPLVGTPLTTSAKFAVVAKSPLTGLLTDALASSHFAIAGKLTGNDAIVVVGRARRPRAAGRRDTVRLEPAATCGGARPPTPRPRLRDAARPRLAGRGDRARRRAGVPLRHVSATTAATPAAAGSARCWAPRTSRRSAVRGAHAGCAG